MEQSQNSQGGSRMDVSQGSQIGKGKNKRFWTKEEEWALINGLLELSVDPQWKVEGNFKSGYLVKLEEMMNTKCPGSGLKAYPHIDSKTKWFRDKYNVLVELINGLLELSADPQWKVEGNFKSGYLVKLEEMLNAKCPGSGLKAYPHIDSKTKWFRDKYNVLVEMFRTSGFTWDDTTKMIKCERQSYDDFCKVNLLIIFNFHLLLSLICCYF